MIGVRASPVDDVRSRYRWPVLFFLSLSVVLGLTVWQSSEHLPHGEAQGRVALRHGDEVLGPWLFWDGYAHNDIAQHGYTDADVAVFKAHGEARVAFFPGYPLAVRAVGSLVGDIALAEVLVTFIAGLGLAGVLYRWFAAQVGPPVARLGLMAVFLFPWALFFVAAGYGDAMFVLAAVSAFALLEDDRPVAAGLVGAVASLTRFVGLGVVLGLAVRAAERSGALAFDGWRPRVERTKIHARDAGVLLAGSGLGAYMVFCWVRYGTPFAFAVAQRGWNQGSGPRTWFKLELIEIIQHEPNAFFVWRLVAHGVVVILFCLAIPAVWRRLGAGYGTYTTVVLALPLIGSAAFASQGRYVLAAFPVFALLGERLQRMTRPLRVTFLVASGTALVLVTSFWARGFWMA